MSCILGYSIVNFFSTFAWQIVLGICTIIATWISIHEYRRKNYYIIRITECNCGERWHQPDWKQEAYLSLQFENLGRDIEQPNVKIQFVCKKTYNYSFVFIKSYGQYDETIQPNTIGRGARFNCVLQPSNYSDFELISGSPEMKQIRIIVKSDELEVFSFLAYNGKEIKPKIIKVKNLEKYFAAQKKKGQKKKMRNITPNEIRSQIDFFRKQLLKKPEQNQQ